MNNLHKKIIKHKKLFIFLPYLMIFAIVFLLIFTPTISDYTGIREAVFLAFAIPIICLILLFSVFLIAITETMSKDTLILKLSNYIDNKEVLEKVSKQIEKDGFITFINFNKIVSKYPKNSNLESVKKELEKHNII